MPNGTMTVPEALLSVARFPEEATAEVEASVWADVLAVAARELAARSRSASSWRLESQARVLAAIDEVARLATVARAPVLAAQESYGAWRSSGARRFEDFRASRTRAGKGAARREISGARAVAELDGGLDALSDGTLTPAHAERLGSIADKLAAEDKSALLAGAGAVKIKELARKHDATRFGGKVEDLAAALSARRVEEAHQDSRRRRHLELVPTADGMLRISGLLDAVAGHTVTLALEAANPSPAADDDRTRGQRNADALVALASAGLAEAKATGNARTQVLITMTEETFTEARSYLEAGTRAAVAPVEDHGHTDIDRGVLVCSFHHHELHRRDLDLVRDGDRSDHPPRGRALPGSPGFDPPSYRRVPRSTTRADRAAAKRSRLLVGVRADSVTRKARRESRAEPDVVDQAG